MDPFEAIKKERKTGKVICGVAAGADSVGKAAAAFGLKDDEKLYRETDMDMARAIIVNVLHRDLAYGNRLIALGRAEELASQVMQRIVQGGTRYYTNAEFKHGAAAALVLSRWDPATASSFDTGVLILGGSESACVWVADED
jgi:hypothetical protein